MNETEFNNQMQKFADRFNLTNPNNGLNCVFQKGQVEIEGNFDFQFPRSFTLPPVLKNHFIVGGRLRVEVELDDPTLMACNAISITAKLHDTTSPFSSAIIGEVNLNNSNFVLPISMKMVTPSIQLMINLQVLLSGGEALFVNYSLWTYYNRNENQKLPFEFGTV